MPAFGQKSKSLLDTCEEPLRVLFNQVVIDYDCIILEGERTPEQQAKNVAAGVSRTMDSKHIPQPGGKSRAVDAAPFPLMWPRRDLLSYPKDLARYYLFGGYVLATAKRLGIAIRWGGDWDGDWDIKEQNFDDLVHFELV